MPELPDVEGFRRLVSRRGLRKRIARVSVGDRRILGKGVAGGLNSRLAGARLIAARRHGKHLLVRVDKGGWLALHFGLSGGLQFFEDPRRKPPFTRMQLDFARGGHLAYTNKRMIGRIGLIADDRAFIAHERLGPDALGRRFGFKGFRAVTWRSRRAIKAVLMDQHAVAGIGNIYSDEILFQAWVNPRRRADQLGPPSLRRVYRKIRTTLTTAIRRGIRTELPGKRVPRAWLLRERKKGGHCPRCGGQIKIARMQGRTAYYCARCQV